MKVHLPEWLLDNWACSGLGRGGGRERDVKRKETERMDRPAYRDCVTSFKSAKSVIIG
jgi:hypothetical protein